MTVSYNNIHALFSQSQYSFSTDFGGVALNTAVEGVHIPAGVALLVRVVVYAAAYVFVAAGEVDLRVEVSITVSNLN